MTRVTTVLAFVSIVCGYSYITGATIYTKYKREFIHYAPNNNFGVAWCGAKTVGDDYCAARVTNSTCEPLTRDWCETRDTTNGGVHIIKTSIRETVQERFRDGQQFRRTIPISMGGGSVLTTTFTPHQGWTQCRISLKTDSGNTPLSILLSKDDEKSPGMVCLKAKINGNSFEYMLYEQVCHAASTYVDDAEYTFKINCETDNFQISLNGGPEWIYDYHLPVNGVTDWVSYCTGAGQDIRNVTFYNV